MRDRRTYHKDSKDKKYNHPHVTDITWEVLKEMYREKLEKSRKRKTKQLF